jgi:hypothetical protein
MDQVPKSVLKVVRRGSSSMPAASFTPATSCMMHLWRPFPCLFNAYAKWKSRSMWLMEHTRQVSLSRGCHYRASCGCTLSLGSRGENSGPRVGKNESNNHIPCGASSKPLACLTLYHSPLIISHHPFILGSFTAQIHQLDGSEFTN